MCRLRFKFYQDVMEFILFLACVAFFGMAYSVYSYTRFKAWICVGRDLNFTQRTMKLIIFLACVAFFGMAYSVYFYISFKFYQDAMKFILFLACVPFLGWLTVSILTYDSR